MNMTTCMKVMQLHPPVSKMLTGSIHSVNGNRILSSFYHSAYWKLHNDDKKCLVYTDGGKEGEFLRVYYHIQSRPGIMTVGPTRYWRTAWSHQRQMVIQDLFWQMTLVLTNESCSDKYDSCSFDKWWLLFWQMTVLWQMILFWQMTLVMTNDSCSEVILWGKGGVMNYDEFWLLTLKCKDFKGLKLKWQYREN